MPIETKVGRGYVVIDQERCKGCGLCFLFCSRGVLGPADQRNSKGLTPAAVKRPERCTGCALCAWMCPDVAITIFKSPKGGS